MTLEIIEHDTAAPLIPLIDQINADKEPWGIVSIKRRYLRPTTNDAFLLSIQSALPTINQIHVFFAGDRNIYIAWCGKQKTIYANLRNHISTSLMHPGLTIEPSAMVVYINPHTHGEKLKTILKTEKNAPNKIDESLFVDSDDDIDPSDLLPPDESVSALKATREQLDFFHEASSQKISRRQLQILVVEDQIFSQKLLCEILRGVRLSNNNESPGIEATTGIQEGWKLFLKRAPDITFIDLNLADGSGHTLARAIKELDPQSRIVIVTANNYEEELKVARQNNVDSFIAKPYNKKQILDCVATYVNSFKNKNKGVLRGIG